MKYIFLIAAFNALFFTVLLVQKKSKAFYDKILIAWLLYLAFYTGIHGIFSSVLFTNWPLLSAAFISLLLLHGPFLYLYVQMCIRDRHFSAARNTTDALTCIIRAICTFSLILPEKNILRCFGFTFHYLKFRWVFRQAAG